MTTIYKYFLNVTDQQYLVMPKFATILAVQIQYDKICLWALIETENEPLDRRDIRIYGTGNPITGDKRYIGTVQMGPLVWHVFEGDYPKGDL